jgi:hypothetical protein
VYVYLIDGGKDRERKGKSVRKKGLPGSAAYLNEYAGSMNAAIRKAFADRDVLERVKKLAQEYANDVRARRATGDDRAESRFLASRRRGMSALRLWKLNERSGLWDYQRSVTPETADEWRRRFQIDEPRATFAVSKNRPVPPALRKGGR